MSESITPTAKEREHAKNYPADAAVDIARLAIKREPKYNRIALVGAAIEAHAVEALIGHVAALTAENERLRSLFDAEDAKALDEYAEDEARSVGSHLHHLAARIRAALPSSRETTDG